MQSDQVGIWRGAGPPNIPHAVSVSTAECQDEGIQRYPEVSPESDPTSCILCCSLTAVGGSKNGVKPELARIKTTADKVGGKKEEW